MRTGEEEVEGVRVCFINRVTRDKNKLTGHGLVGDTSVWVDLLQDSVDVGGVGFLADLGSLLLVTRLRSGLGGLLGSLGGFGRCLSTGGSRGLGGS